MTAETHQNSLVSDDGALLNHLSVRYAAGEKDKVAKVFELLGFGVTRREDMDVIVVKIDPEDTRKEYVNRIAVWQMPPQQAAMEAVLKERLTDPEAQEAYQAYDVMAGAEPDRVGHFGIRMASMEHLEGAVAAIENTTDPDLVGRVKICGWCRPGDPTSHSATLAQAFVWTDLFAPGLIGPGIHFELQYPVA